MPEFQSNEEFFQAVRDLVARLKRGGHGRAAAELNKGLGCLNGLTDGSALFLEAIERVTAADSARFAPDDRQALEAIRKSVRQTVYRR